MVITLTEKQAETLCNISCAPLAAAHEPGGILTSNGCKVYAKTLASKRSAQRR